MYWYAKLIIVLIVISILGGIAYAFRGPIGNVIKSIGEKKSEAAGKPEDSGAPDVPSSGAATTGAERSPVPAEFLPLKQKLQLAGQLYRQDELLKARKIVENLLLDENAKEFSPIWLEAIFMLSEINTRIIFSGAPCPEQETYIVAPGDNLTRIAKLFNTTTAFVVKSNGITGENIFPNQTLKVYKAAWNIHVSKTHRVLQLKDGNRTVIAYKVGIGRQDRTPAGTFVIKEKLVDPAWTPPGKHIEPGDPDNILGSRWMGLRPILDTSQDLKSYGIHGTTEPDSIGKAESNGCIRMLKKDVEELFDIVPTATKVTIIE